MVYGFAREGPKRRDIRLKPPPFEYAAAESVEAVITLLARHRHGAKLIAGGQSLTPMLNFRLLAPDILIDLCRIPDLDRIEPHGGGFRIGALVRYRQLIADAGLNADCPIVPHVIRHVAHRAIRNRGTVGGSLAHADPAAELPMLAVLLDGRVGLAGPYGRKTAGATDIFKGPLTTNLAEDEMIVSLILPRLADNAGWGFEEVARRAGDFALAGAGAVITRKRGAIDSARVAVMGVDETPRRLPAVERGLTGRPFDAAARTDAVAAARTAVNPTTDLQASADYRRHLAGVVVGRALDRAWAGAAEPAA